MANIAYIEDRTIDLACYIIENKSTIRVGAAQFGISKSTAHSDLSERLPKINPALYAELKNVLKANFADRQVRGGRATQRILHARQKFKKENESCI